MLQVEHTCNEVYFKKCILRRINTGIRLGNMLQEERNEIHIYGIQSFTPVRTPGV